jgi:hypothetical protein
MMLTADTLLRWATEVERLAHALERLQEHPEDAALIMEEQRLADVVLAYALQLARAAPEN